MKQLQTINGETLMSKPLQPMNFVVDTLLSQGLHILAGSPKAGKSWLALWLAITVAKGKTVWKMSVKQGTTLYLCLEDSQLRIQNRLFEITDDAPANVHFCTECNTLGHGLEEQLENFVATYPDTVLVIIDTLQMIRCNNYDFTYANDYRDLSVLKKIADEHQIAILLIHHLRKGPSDNVFDRISGTTAISGAVDSSFTLINSSHSSGRRLRRPLRAGQPPRAGGAVMATFTTINCKRQSGGAIRGTLDYVSQKKKTLAVPCCCLLSADCNASIAERH